MEPTLSLILQSIGVVVLSNELGLIAKSIRDLCDVRNSTKNGSNAGYIGQKGIGFKSVFWVTDSPEIHSNGFHMKFDITEWELSFILPTLVPLLCNLELFSRELATGNENLEGPVWNTCIVHSFQRLTRGRNKNEVTGFKICRSLSIIIIISSLSLLYHSYG